MDSAIIQNSITSFMIICVIIVFALVFMRSRWFTEVYEGRIKPSTALLLILFFGILSVFGSSTGLLIFGAAVNVRDLGAMAAGLICGPYIGLGAGIIGGLFRFAQGGPYMWTGLSAPILSGILGGVLYLANKCRFVPTWVAVLYIGISETLISCYTLVLVTKPEQFFSVLTSVAIPMILFNAIGMFIFASVVHYSLNERKSQEEKRLLELEVESKRNLSTIINTIPFPIYVLDCEHRFVLVNESLCRFIGHSEAEILHNTPRDFFNEKDADFHWKMTEDVFDRKTIRSDEVAITCTDGRPCTLISTAALYTDATGVEFMVGSIQDITEREKMQTALKESEAWYRTLFEHTGAATVIIRNDGIIDQANSIFSTMTGYTREEIEGKVNFLQVVCPDDLDQVKEYHTDRRRRPGLAPTNYEVRIHDRTGAIRTLHAVVALIPGTDMSIASYIDISEQKKTQDALTQVNRKLNLLSSITRHDIINQILILKGFLALIHKKTTDPVLTDYIERSEKATRNIEHQIIFTRDYQDMGIIAPLWQNVKKSVINAKGALAMGTVTVETDHAGLEVFADPLFEKVFYNLIDNSLKYGGGKLHTIRISSHETAEGLTIIYEDDGAGISAQDRAHLFERGYGKHSGFGLFLSREILSITAITITETGEEGSGARFTLRVPRGMYRFVAGPIL